MIACCCFIMFTGIMLRPLIKLFNVPLETTVIVKDEDGNPVHANDGDSSFSPPISPCSVVPSEPTTPGFLQSNQTTVTTFGDMNQFNFDVMQHKGAFQRSNSIVSNRSALSQRLKGIHDDYLRPWLVHGAQKSGTNTKPPTSPQPASPTPTYQGYPEPSPSDESLPVLLPVHQVRFNRNRKRQNDASPTLQS